MKNKKAIINVFKLVDLYKKMNDQFYTTYSERTYEKRFGKWANDNWEGLRSIALYLITGEPDFNDFYDRFDAPAGLDRKTKPIAWKTRENGSPFIPDYICDIIFGYTDAETVDEKVRDIRIAYRECKKIERKFEYEKNRPKRKSAKV